MNYVICVISVLQVALVILLIVFYKRIKFLIELESECIRFDVLMINKSLFRDKTRQNEQKLG
jgi:hypothetical protein